MRIGLTYDLKSEYLALGMTAEECAELDSEVTILGLEGAIRAYGHEPVRIGHAKSLVQKLATGERWDLVFNIAEGIRGAARESQVPSILDVYGIPYTFSDPLVLGICLHKGLTKTVVRAAGIPTPDFALVSSTAEIDAIDLPFPLFVKPVAEGTSKGVTPRSLVKDRATLRDSIEWILATFEQPALVETYLSGREFTIGLVGTGDRAEVLGTQEVLLLAAADAGMYSFENKHTWEDKVTYRFLRPDQDPEVRAAEKVALDAWRALGCRDAGRADVRSDAHGRPSLIEVNPLAGLNPELSDLSFLIRAAGIPYQRLIERILESAIRRAGLS